MADVYKPITKITNYRTSPYYDTFDERNNYHRVLFRPGYAVQARELTQLQTAFQAQIDRHGQHSFSDGAAVVGSGTTVDTEYAYIKCEDEFYSTVATGSGAAYDTSTYISEFVDKTIIGTDNVSYTVIQLDVLSKPAAIKFFSAAATSNPMTAGTFPVSPFPVIHPNEKKKMTNKQIVIPNPISMFIHNGFFNMSSMSFKLLDFIFVLNYLQ